MTPERTAVTDKEIPDKNNHIENKMDWDTSIGYKATYHMLAVVKHKNPEKLAVHLWQAGASKFKLKKLQPTDERLLAPPHSH
jgi:hypothetical protein